MNYKFELILLTQKMAHKYKFIQTLSFSNFIYRVRSMIRFFMVYLYWTPHFLHWIKSLKKKKRKKKKRKEKTLRLDGTFGTKLHLIEI